MSHSSWFTRSFTPRVLGLASLCIATAILVGRREGAAAMPAASAYHVHLLKSEPAPNDTVRAALSAIKLWFSEDVELAITSVKVMMPMGSDTMAVATSAPHRDAADHSPVVTDITNSLAPGSYVAMWKTSAKDGHPAAGTIAFVVVRGGAAGR